VTLILFYIAFMVGGAFAAYFLGLFVEYEWGPHVSLIVFLAVYPVGLLGACSLGNRTASARHPTARANPAKGQRQERIGRLSWRPRHSRPITGGPNPPPLPASRRALLGSCS
jgi:hypothetical protein